jgi:hypothetical protein
VVIAGVADVIVHAPGGRITGIVRAGVVVVAIRRGVYAPAGGIARIIRAGIPVIAQPGVRMHTNACIVANVIRTGISIVGATRFRRPWGVGHLSCV